MTRLARLLVAALLLVAAAPALPTSTSLGTLTVIKGFVGSACIDFGEDVSGAAMILRVYSVAPNQGVGGTLRFPAKTLAARAGYPRQQCVPLVSSDTAVPTGALLYAELDVVWPDGSNTPQLLSFGISGR